MKIIKDIKKKGGSLLFCGESPIFAHIINHKTERKMRRKVLLLALMAMMSVGATAQKYTVRHKAEKKQTTDSIVYDKDSHFYKAGHCLDMSSRYDIASWGLTAASGICYIAAFDRKGDNSSTLKTLGLAFAISAVATRVYSITWKMNAGWQLQMSAGTVKVTF